MFYKFFIKTKLVLIFSIILLFISPETIFAKKVSNKYEVKTFWEEQPITPGAAYYFIRTEKIEKRTKSLNNHPIKISEDVLRKMLKQLSYKYDNEHPEIPLFSKRELILLSKFVPQAFITAKSNEDVTFVTKGLHTSARWALAEERLTAGRFFVADNKLNLIIGAVQVDLQPSLGERYEGNVWEARNVDYDLGYRDKQAKYEGLIMVYNKNKGIYRKSSTRKDWFVFTNSAYREAMEGTNTNNKKGGMSKKEYKNLQQQIDSLQKQLNKNPKQKQRALPPVRKNQTIQKKPEPEVNNKKENVKNNSSAIEQRIKTIENLYKKGILSEEEYQKKRNDILKGI